MRGRRVPGDTRAVPEGNISIIQEDRVWNRRRSSRRGETISIGIGTSIRVESINVSREDLDEVVSIEIIISERRPVVSLIDGSRNGIVDTTKVEDVCICPGS